MTTIKMTITQEKSQIEEQATSAIKLTREKLERNQSLIIEARKNKEQIKKLEAVSKKYDVLEEEVAGLLDRLLGEGAGRNFKSNIFKGDIFGSTFDVIDERCKSISRYLIPLIEELKLYPDRSFKRWTLKKILKATYTLTKKELIIHIADKDVPFEVDTNMFLLAKVMIRIKIGTPIDWGVAYYRMFKKDANIRDKKHWRLIYNAKEGINSKISDKLEQDVKLLDLKNRHVIRLF